MMKIHLITSAQKIDGGGKEIFNLITAVKEKINTTIVTIWKSKDKDKAYYINDADLFYLTKIPANKKIVIPSIPFVLFSLLKYKAQNIHNTDYILLTHYSTFLYLLISKKNIIYFVQDLEWLFIKNKLMSLILKKVILNAYKKGKIIVANKYLEDELLHHNIKVDLNINIWAAPEFYSTEHLPTNQRKIDFAMMLRKGEYKRLDLYDAFINLAIKNGMKISFITQEDEIFNKYKKIATISLLKARPDEMRQLYKDTKFFIHLSDHEGFGLPPLEAMGSGCIPFCRDSKGIQAYMKESLSDNIFTLDTEIEHIFSHIIKLKTEDINIIQKNCLSTFKNGLASKLDAKDIQMKLLEILENKV